ncbi:Biopolymer transport protein ExbD [Fontimonas thermophila]|uniref:Biopolymer transport protein ExbD n=1 Tax=Fontimonas thermophila TaxID=1076937 RepID=A0A1I2KBW2_9GAMM|nr:biopolymer transporter ExbD [Fontimonas thermophila]SFF63700.1 Biopolymer transport protein ExbD [Fontimonas thermophila]
MRLEWARRRHSRLALTALVDVVFILLFFFMLAGRAAPPRAIELHVASGMTGMETVAEVIVRAGGYVELDGRRLAIDALVHESRGRALQLRAGADARLQDLVDVLDRLRDAGVRIHVRP